MRILMVCLGNICRSPLAEGILQSKAQKAGLDWTVESAGTLKSHCGEAPHPLSQKVAKLNGIDISKQRARQFTKEDLAHYDQIYAMATDVLDEINMICGGKSSCKNVQLFLDALFPGERVDVPDPWYGTEPGYHEVYTLINKACDAIIEKYQAGKSKTIAQ